MEKIIFLSLALPILGFVLYLGVSAILKGFKAKNDRILGDLTNEEDTNSSLGITNDNLSDELIKLNELFKNGVLTQEEFERAKKKLIES
jgi:hypothetical protein